MNDMKDPNNPDIGDSENISGYRLIRTARLPERNAFFYELEHPATGTRHAHISNDDAENAFGVMLKTVPADSTGVAHILEHTALCGSAKFPVRDPFFSMLKRSLKTFMNAFTASDWTMYPFSTQNKKDFYNLLDVYLDAVFHPNLDLLSFRQEGHRLEIEAPADGAGDGKLTFAGVVYNEMKGAMSTPSQVMGRSILNALYPDTTYRFNSGGEPADIPSLTHAQLKAFHGRHYHPSNAFFYTYGNLPLREHLTFIEEKVLKQYDKIDPKTDVPAQPRWSEPREAVYYYPLDPNEDPEKKSQVCLAWLTADVNDAFDILALTLLEQILIGNPASPLRKALIDSELGSALSDGSGFEPDMRDALFACGLKDVKESDAGRIEEIIFTVLKDLAEKGIDPKIVDSAIHKIEFHRKEVTNTPYPYGLKLFLSFSGSWIHGGDPVKILQFDDDLKEINARRAKGPFFEDLIRRYFLENPHRTLFRLVPDTQLGKKQAEAEQAALEKIRAGLSAGDMAGIAAESRALRERQEATEDDACLPTLDIEDIPPKVKTVEESAAPGDLPAATYDQPTAGIFYFTAAAGLGLLSADQLPLAPFFCFALPKIGTQKRDYTDMAYRIESHTGGIGLSTHARVRYDAAGKCMPFITFNGKCLDRKAEKMFDIIDELLTSADFADLSRLKSLLLEYRAGLESMVVQNGHNLAISMAARNFSKNRALSEMWNGIHQLRTIKAVTEDLSETALGAFARDLAAMGKTLFARNNLKAAVIGEEQALAAASAPVKQMLGGLPDGAAAGFAPPQIEPENAALTREGWSTSTSVSFVAGAFETVRMADEASPALAVIGKMLRSLYLHREIREKGGAYGGFAMYNPEDGLFCMGSYRDPHILATLKAYEGAAEFIRSGAFAGDDVKEAILQVCAEIDKPDPPGPAARKAFYRNLIGLTDHDRNLYKSRLLALDPDRVIAAADAHFENIRDKMAVAVISGRDRLEQANAGLGDAPLTLHRI